MSASALLVVAALGVAAAGTRWHVDVQSPEADPDGSAARPFRSIGQALARARDADEIAVAPGVYVERLVIDRRVRVIGSGSTVLRPPEPAGEVVRLEAAATLERLHLTGGEVGIRVRAPAELRGLVLEQPLRAAIVVEGAPARLTSSRIRASAERHADTAGRRPVGIEVSAGAQLVASEVAFEGPWRFAVRSRGRLELDRLSVVGAVAGVGCFEGCSAAVTHSTFEQGEAAGLLAGSGGRLTARDCLITRYETGIAANPGATVRLEETLTAFCLNSGIAAVKAELVALGHVHVGPARMAAIHLLESNAHLLGGAISDPGATGISVRLGSLVARGVSVRGAQLDAEGDLGDGIFAIEPGRLLLLGTRLEQNAGAGLTVLGGRARVEGLEALRNGIAGVAAQRGAQVQVHRSRVEGNEGPGLVALEGSWIEATQSRLEGNDGGPARADCSSRSQILLASDDARGAREASCTLP